jgi:putative ABC transport system substrate-binding protein
MNRRAFLSGLSGGLLAAPLAAEAQQTTRLPPIGFLCNTARLAAAFDEGLRDLGYINGRNIPIERRCLEGRMERASELAADLLRLKPDVLVGATDPVVKVLAAATKTIPIVMTSGDPLGNQFAVSLARPGRNVTGVSLFAHELAAKRLELLKTAFPDFARLTVLVNPTNPNASRQLSETEAAAQAIGVRLTILRVHSATEFDKTFGGLRRGPAAVLLVSFDALFFAERRRIAEFALANQLPTLGFAREFAEDGALMSYGANLSALYRRAAWYVDKILRGAKPADLPIEQPTKFELVINLKTAKTLSLTIPPSLLQRADQVIE